MTSPRSSTSALLLWSALAVGFLFAGGCGLLSGAAPVLDVSRDAELVRAVQARLAAEPSIDEEAIRVEASGGVILLYGSVSGMGQWNCAIRNAQLVQGVRTVVDYLVIERGPRTVRCGAPRDSD